MAHVDQILPLKPHMNFFMSRLHQILPPKPHMNFSYVSRAPDSPTKPSYERFLCLTWTRFSHQTLIWTFLMPHVDQILPPKPHMNFSYVSRAPDSPTKTSYEFFLCLTCTRFSHQNLICHSLSPTCTTLPVKHIFIWFDDSSTTFQGMQTRKLIMMWFSPISYYFLSHWSKYRHQHYMKSSVI
jgi:hypothetical protein